MEKLNDVYVIGVGLHPATLREQGLRLEEMVYHTARKALKSCGVNRRQLDNVVLGASDEFDGRPISSMLMTGPAGGYLTDEIRVTDSGATALCLGYARIRSGDFNISLVSSWCKSSKSDTEDIMRFRGDPFYMRPLGFNAGMANGLFAQALSIQHGVTEAEVNRRVYDAGKRAAANERGLRAKVVDLDAIAASDYLATPLREAQIAPASDGAVSMVLCSAHFLRANPQCKPLARMTGAGWATDSYRMGADRLGQLQAAKRAWAMALQHAGLSTASQFDVIELDSPTGWHEAAWVRAFDLADETIISPSGGTFAQNPLFCSGLVNAAEAVLQVAGQAGDVQCSSVRRAAAHGCHGYAQQGNVVMTFEQAA